ncbi:MAG: S-layer homology domain-containing protein [Candidatus Peregrinibacteria bacterium]|nr:S-layer homology domain-containing protein [Candidatus Peregrinibacteria bacterium]
MKNRNIKNILAKVLLTVLVFNLSVVTAFASGFSDISSTTPNSEAILYLQDHGIVKGYDDGTFKPTRDVNRAELLKIIIEGSKIQLDVTDTTPFKDIDYSQWYAPYVKKAYSEGWINGYNDGTFKPTQTVNKVEALKIIGKAQSWQLKSTESFNIQSVFSDIEKNSWYEPYVTFAESNKYLEEKGPTFSPIKLMTRGSISEIIYRTIVSTNTPVTDPTNTNPGSTDPVTNTTNFGLIANDSYQNIKLSENLPNTFYKNEVYIIKGDVVGSVYNSATVILDAKDKTSHQYFSGPVTNKHFEIPVYFKNSGDYFLGLVPGDSGNSDAFEVYVNSDLPSASTNSAAPANLKNALISYGKDKTSIDFNNITNTLKRFDFTQNNKTVTYLSRQNISSINLRYSDFENFTQGSVNYSTSIAKVSSQSPLIIDSAFSPVSTKSFNAVDHSFTDDNTSEIQISIPDNLSSPKKISLTGTAKTDIKNEALIITPSGEVDQLELATTGQTYTYFNQTLIKSGSSFAFEYTPKTTGRYIVELNNKNSEPSINHPVYVGNIVPLIPDFFDLNERAYYKDSFNLTNERKKLLNLINQSRSAHGLAEIVMDDQLNILAQEHSDDMKTNNYFSHYDLNNKTPEDRRIALGITTPVGENIAKDISVEFAHFGLMRSASHYENILTSEWKKVGLGISLDQGELIITEEFAINPITAEDLAQFKIEILNSINDLRQSKNLSLLTENDSLNKSSEQVNTDNINSLPINDQTLSKALNDNNFTGGAQLIGRVGSPWSYLIKSIITGEASLLDATWKNIGSNIQTDKNGKIYTIVIVGD